MQRAVRRRLDQEIGRPCMQDIVKAMLMISQAPAKYHEFPDRLTTCLNYAMVLHTQVPPRHHTTTSSSSPLTRRAESCHHPGDQTDRVALSSSSTDV